jgi:hypothetical protein
MQPAGRIKGVICLIVHDQIDSLQRAAHDQRGGLMHLGKAGDVLRAQSVAFAFGQQMSAMALLAYSLNVLAVVDEGNFFIGGIAWKRHIILTQQTVFLEQIVGEKQAALVKGMVVVEVVRCVVG